MVLFKRHIHAKRKKPKSKRVRTEIVGGHAGRAGSFASMAMVVCGIVLGGLASYIGGQGNQVAARYSGFDRITKFEIEGAKRNVLLPDAEPLREGYDDRVGLTQREILRDGSVRDDIVQQVLEGGHSVEGNALEVTPDMPMEARVAIVFDDMGPDRAAFEKIINFQGPLTFSFLPYAKNIQSQVTAASEHGDGIMLHLPMEPIGPQDPGPHALTIAATEQQMLNNLAWNLKQFKGYSGVNNHMGSKFSADAKRMTLVLAELEARGLFYLDSVTTPKSAAGKTAFANTIEIIKRDVFLDPEKGEDTVKKQLQQVEEIALRTGYAIAIAHPHQDTIDVIGPWLATAQLRGFKLVTVESLLDDTITDVQAEVGQADLVGL